MTDDWKWWLKQWPFVVLALAASGVLTYASYLVFTASEFRVAVGEALLQVASAVIVGGLAAGLFNRALAYKAKQEEKSKKRADLLRRVRAVHVHVSNARDLLNAHDSAKTWAEQMRRLMGLRPEVEEISEEVQVSVDLFRRKEAIVAGLEGIVGYLKIGAQEYVAHHADVEADHEKNKAAYSVSASIKDRKMHWVRDLMNGNASYDELYVGNLKNAKGSMRREAYGAPEGAEEPTDRFDGSHPNQSGPTDARSSAGERARPRPKKTKTAVK